MKMTLLPSLSRSRRGKIYLWKFIVFPSSFFTRTHINMHIQCRNSESVYPAERSWLTEGSKKSSRMQRCGSVCLRLKYLSRVCWAMGTLNFLTRKKRSKKLASAKNPELLRWTFYFIFVFGKTPHAVAYFLFRCASETKLLPIHTRRGGGGIF